MDKKYQVFVSSTFTDMQAERQAAVTAILEAGHIPAGMELFSASDKKQIEVIRRWIDRSDMFMLILGGRYGSVDADSGKSYIQLEYEYAVATNKPFFALYLTEDAIEKKTRGPLGLAAVERNDTIKLNKFRTTVKGRLCSEMEDLKDIRIQIPKAIREIADTNKLDGWIRASSVPEVDQATDRRAVFAPKIEIVTEASAPYQVDEILSDHVRSTVKVGVRNAGGKTLSNCKVYIEDISPPTNSPGGPTLLLDGSGFQLRYDDPEKLVDVAAHWDNHDKFKFSTPLGGGFFDTTQLMDEKTRRAFSIRVTATQCNRSARFEIWVDESKRLHLAFLNYLD